MPRLCLRFVKGGHNGHNPITGNSTRSMETGNHDRSKVEASRIRCTMVDVLPSPFRNTIPFIVIVRQNAKFNLDSRSAVLWQGNK